MEEDNDLDVMNINQEIKNKKKEDDIINAHITKEIISKFKALLSGVNDSKNITITNYKIYIYFLHKYIYSRNILYLLKNKNIYISIKNSKKLNYLYSFILFYIFIEHDSIKQQLIELKLLSFDEIFRIIIILYKSKLLSFQNVVDIFKFNFILLKKNNFLTIPQKSNIISRFIKYLWNFSKEIIIQNNKKEIDKLIQKEILPIFFEIINDARNEYNYFFLLNNLKKEENIFLFIKMIINNKFLSDETISLIESNIINFLKNNFRKEHLNYLYKICSKILIKFNYLNTKQFRKTLHEPKKDYLSLNKDFLFLTKIIKILTKVITEEKKQNLDNSFYYCDKGFVFNVEGKNKVGFKVKDVIYNPSKKGATFCVLFTFLLRKNKITNESKIIVSINDSNNKEYFCLFEKGQKLYLRYITKKINEKEIIKNIKYNNYYSFFFFNDKNKNIIKLCINNEDILSEKDQPFNLPNKFQIFVGAPDSNENLKENEYSFNGIIFPILLFELNNKDEIYSEIKNNLLKIKNNYYLITENYFESNMNENIYDNNYEKYFGLYDVLESKENAKIIINNIKNIILYINPYIVLSSFNKKIKIYKDYNYYENNDDKKNIKIQYSYEFNVIPSSENGIIFPFKNNTIISFFKNNNGLNLIILEFELMYNYIFLINDNNNFRQILNENKKEMFSLM